MDLEALLLGERPHLTRVEVAERAGVPLEVAEQLWRMLGFPRAADDDVAFTEADVVALRQARELIELGVIGPDSQAALVRTWGRSFARLAEWQAELLAEVDPDEELSAALLPRVEQLQSYAWRRHLASAAARTLDEAVGTASPLGSGSSTSSATPPAASASTRQSWSPGWRVSSPWRPRSWSTSAAGSSRRSATRCSSWPRTRRPPPRRHC